ncbi:DNA-binding transcriptional response regulator [Terriglobus tenax]|uniref:hypothetical protein n=1 Tax=Terriglobus tenax TaxID=1111115 RepID=UPI0021E0FAD1|nr:hypothetical protein [Terriglobus tenax]
MPAILSIGSDPVLLKTRASLLRQTGAEVASAEPAKAVGELAQKRYDLAVLCHSLRQEDATSIASAIRAACNGCKILMLSRDPVEGVVDGMERCSAHRPEQLLRTVRRLTQS